MGKTDFHRRLLCIEKEIVGPRNGKMQQGKLDRASQAFSVRCKPFWDITTSQKVQSVLCAFVIVLVLFLLSSPSPLISSTSSSPSLLSIVISIHSSSEMMIISSSSSCSSVIIIFMPHKPSVFTASVSGTPPHRIYGQFCVLVCRCYYCSYHYCC